MLLPRPYQDELVGSVVARALVYTGLPAVKLVDSLLGRRVSTLSFFMPAELSRYAQACKVDEEKLLWDHTVFPYVTSYMQQQRVDHLRAKVLNPQAGAGSLASLVQSSTLGAKSLRYCRVCRETEMATHGESYWHRSHNLPAVLFCYRHGCVLHEVPMPTVDRAHLLLLPQYQEGSDCELPAEHGLLMDVATRSARLLNPKEGVRTCPIPSYRARALELGYRLPSGDTSGWQVAQDLYKRFDTLLAKSGSSYAENSKHHWPARMLRPAAGITFTPVKHVLLQSFLANTRDGTKVMEYEAPVRRKRDFKETDLELASIMRMRMSDAIRKQVRLSVKDVMDNTRFWHSFKLHRDRFPATVAALDEYRRSDVALRQKGGRKSDQVANQLA